MITLSQRVNISGMNAYPEETGFNLNDFVYSMYKNVFKEIKRLQQFNTNLNSMENNLHDWGCDPIGV